MGQCTMPELLAESSKELASVMSRLFKGRADCYAAEHPSSANGRASFAPIAQRLTPELVEKQIRGEACIGFYILTEQSKCWVSCVDFDGCAETHPRPDREWKLKAEKVYRWLKGQRLEPAVESSE